MNEDHYQSYDRHVLTLSSSEMSFVYSCEISYTPESINTSVAIRLVSTCYKVMLTSSMSKSVLQMINSDYRGPLNPKANAGMSRTPKHGVIMLR